MTTCFYTKEAYGYEHWRSNMKAIPNLLSISRIIFSIILFFIKPLSIAFFIIYIICGFSDVMDGFIARSMGTQSRVGEKVDSLADLVMVAVLLIVLYPIVNPVAKILIWVILIGLIRLLSAIIALIKYKTFAMLHTYGNKITGLLLFIFPLLLPFINTNTLMYIICSVATITAVEEFIIQVTSRNLNANRKSIFLN